MQNTPPRFAPKERASPMRFRPASVICIFTLSLFDYFTRGLRNCARCRCLSSIRWECWKRAVQRLDKLNLTLAAAWAVGKTRCRVHSPGKQNGSLAVAGDVAAVDGRGGFRSLISELPRSSRSCSRSSLSRCRWEAGVSFLLGLSHLQGQ